MNAHLIIIGASVRAAAMSACRAGYAPWAVDCFTDWDLTTLCDSYQIDDYPYGFPRFLGKLPPAPWMYVGGLENHPDIVDEISRDRLLLGNPGQVLRRVRDPHFVTEFLRKSGVSLSDRFPNSRRSQHGRNLVMQADKISRWWRNPNVSRSVHP